MKKIIRFSKLFTFTAVLSILLVAAGIAGFFVTGGFNLGIDFQAGLIQEIQFAPTAFNLTWSGRGNARIELDRNGIQIVNYGVGIESRTLTFPFNDYSTVGEITDALSDQLEGLQCDLLIPADTSSQWLVRSSQADPRLYADIPYVVHYLDPQSEEIPISTVREALADLGQTVSVQSLGQPGDRHFMIRIRETQEERSAQENADDEDIVEVSEAEEADYEEASAEETVAEETVAAIEEAEEIETESLTETEAAEFEDAQAVTEEIAAEETVRNSPSERIVRILENSEFFNPGEVVVLRSDYVGSRFSKNLTDQVGILIAFTLLLILVYAAIRFKLRYAIGAVLGIIHDSVVVIGFVVWTGMEFTTLTIAAILTILGYSINSTIVIFDRIRENRRLYPDDVFVNVLDRSVTEMLNRIIITTVTTMLAVLSLFLFTTGSMKDFALVLLVGMISGAYTSTFIATGLVNFLEKRRSKKAGSRG